LDRPTTICEAVVGALAKATLAPASIQARDIGGLALGAGALAVEVGHEVTSIWCPQKVELSSLAKCFVSITAKESLKRRADDESPERAPVIPKERHFRLELDRALVNDALPNGQRIAAIRTAAEEALKEKRTIVRNCVLVLKGKQSEYTLFGSFKGRR
jgi:hypothetical protein